MEKSEEKREIMRCPCCSDSFIEPDYEEECVSCLFGDCDGEDHYLEPLWDESQELTYCKSCGCSYEVGVDFGELRAYVVWSCDENPNIECLCETHNEVL